MSSDTPTRNHGNVISLFVLRVMICFQSPVIDIISTLILKKKSANIIFVRYCNIRLNKKVHRVLWYVSACSFMDFTRLHQSKFPLC